MGWNCLRRSVGHGLKGIGNRNEWAGGVAQAVVSDRARDEATQSDMFWCPDDQQRRVLRLSDQDSSGVAAGKLDQPVRPGVVELVETAVMLAR